MKMSIIKIIFSSLQGRLILSLSIIIISCSLSIGQDGITVKGGKIGIGTTDPETTFQILDQNSKLFIREASPASPTFALVDISNGLSGGLRIGAINPNSNQFGGAVIQTYANTGNPFRGNIYLDAGTDANSSIYFRTALQSRMVLRRDGKLGIGTDSPSAKVHVITDHNNSFTFEDGASNITPYLAISSGSGRSIGMMTGASGSALAFDENGPLHITKDSKSNISEGESNGGSPLLTVMPSGKVGIGTPTPSYEFHVKNDMQNISMLESANGPVQLRLQNSLQGNRRIVALNGSAIVQSQITMGDNGVIQFLGNTAADDNMTIYPTGVVVSKDLQVDGNLIAIGKEITSGDARIEVGKDRGSNGHAYIDLVDNPSQYPDYGIRLIRNSGGAGSLVHRGTSPFNFWASEGAPINFLNGSATIASFTSLGILPGIDNGNNLGSSSYRWKEVWSTNGVLQTSDRRFKTNVENLDYGLEKILNLNPVSFYWKDHRDGSHFGLIAQEVQKIIPEIVDNKNIDALAINYTELIPFLIKAIQDQNAEIQALKELIRTKL